MKKIFVITLGLVLLAAGCNKTATTNNSNQPSNEVSGPSVEIDMTAKGFNPADVTVKAGTTVIFKNTDNQPHWPASNPHPTHTDLPGFDALRGLTADQTYAFTFTKLGTWGFHDHLNHTIHGSVTVVAK